MVQTLMEDLRPLALCLGVPKAATTWVHRQLESHPQIACTTTKEVGYWTRNYDKGPEWYRDQFNRTHQTRVFAEVTPHYLNERALSRIAADVQDVRFIVVLRNPYERAFSDYLNCLRNREVTGSFANAVRVREKILRNSLYGRALGTYLNFFSLDQLHVILYESISSEPERVVEAMYGFLGVDARFVPDQLRERINVGRSGSGTDHFLKRLEILSKRFGLRREHLVRLRLDRIVENLHRRLARRHPAPKMSLADQELIADVVEDDLTCLERLLDRDFSGWRAGGMNDSGVQGRRGRDGPVTAAPRNGDGGYLLKESIKGVLNRYVRPLTNLHVQGSAPSIFILSTPRSGSTWLMETIGTGRHMKPCNEPFNLRKPDVVAALGISEWDELESVASLPKIERYLRAFEAGSIRVGFKNLRPFEKGYRPFTRRIVFKILHACENRVDWLRERFGARTVYLLRHPAPVSLSRKELPRLSCLVETRLSGEQREFGRRLLHSGNSLERSTLDWCLQNKPLLDSLTQLDVVVTYEQLVIEPHVVVDRLIEALNLENAAAVVQSVDGLSRSVAKSNAARLALLQKRHRNPEELVTRWQQDISEEQVQVIDRILKSLEIDAYSATDPWPARRLWIG